MPLSLRPLVSLAEVLDVWLVVDEKNSRSAFSGKGVGVSNTSVSTMEPFEEPKETLQVKRFALIWWFVL